MMEKVIIQADKIETDWNLQSKVVFLYIPSYNMAGEKLCVIAQVII